MSEKTTLAAMESTDLKESRRGGTDWVIIPIIHVKKNNI